MNGKGSKARPLSVSREEFDRNWDRAFKRKAARLMKEIRETEPEFVMRFPEEAEDGQAER